MNHNWNETDAQGKPLPSNCVEIAVFVGGASHVFDYVDQTSIIYGLYRGNARTLFFRQGLREVIIPNVDYWTEKV